MRVRALEEALNSLVQVQTSNQMEIRKAFMMTDAHLFVLKNISENICAGTLQTTKGVDGDEIDFRFYYDRFNEGQELAAKAREASQITGRI